MTTLRALWDVSLILCTVASLTLLCLLLARIFSEGRERRRQLERERVKPLLLSHGNATAIVPSCGALEKRAALHLTVQLAELVRGSDRDALLKNADRLGVRETLYRQSTSRVAQDRLLAAEALAMFPDETDRVCAMLDDRNPDVRLGAALALAHNHRAPSAKDLVVKLGLGTSEKSLLIVSLMRDLVDRDAEDVEAMLYDAGLADAPKLAATDALAESGRVQHAPLVAWMAEAAEDDSQLLPRIYHALGRIGHPEGHRAIARGLDHPEWQVRAAAAQAAGMSRFTGAAGQLAEMLDDEQWWVRFRASEALGRLGKTGMETLARVAQAGSERSREAARLTLAELGTR